MHSFSELLRLRRSIRSFEDRNVPDELLCEIIQDSTQAPSSGNEQPWLFSIVSDTSLMKDISRDCKQALLKRIEDAPNAYVAKYKGLLEKPEFDIFYGAPSLVYILGLKSLKNSEVNCTLAASYFMLSAADRGLGTCWINFAKHIRDERIKASIGLEDGLFIVAPLIVGYPTRIPASPKRKDAIILKAGNPQHGRLDPRA